MKKVLALLTLGLLGVSGVGMAAAKVVARQNHPQMATLPQAMTAQLGRGEDREMEEAREEQQEDAQLKSLAKITPQQAEAIARQVTPGNVSRISLDNEDGSVVYKVIIGQREVMVDAGNGRVLETEPLGQEAAHDTAPTGSIRVPQNN